MLGFLPWWTGTIYATGFLVPVAIAVLIVPPRQGPPDTTVESHVVNGQDARAGAGL